MSKLKRIELRVSVEVSAGTTVSAVREAIFRRLGDAPEDVVWQKQSPPWPDQHGRIHWATANVKQGKAK